MVTKTTSCRIFAVTLSAVIFTIFLYRVPGSERDLNRRSEIGKRNHDVISTSNTETAYEIFDTTQGEETKPGYSEGADQQGVQARDAQTSTKVRVEVANCSKEDIHNFFTDMKHSFADIVGPLDQPIQTKEFLDCCLDLTDIFDRLGKALSLIEDDLRKNIKVVREKYETNKTKYSLLVAIVKEEAAAGVHTKSYSVTDSILWLTRSIMLMKEMFKHIKTEDNFSRIVSLAYESTLKQYHGFVVKSLFSMLSPALPSKDSVMDALATTEQDKNKPGYEACLYASADGYNKGVMAVCENIRKLLASYGIELMKGS